MTLADAGAVILTGLILAFAIARPLRDAHRDSSSMKIDFRGGDRTGTMVCDFWTTDILALRGPFPASSTSPLPTDAAGCVEKLKLFARFWCSLSNRAEG